MQSHTNHLGSFVGAQAISCPKDWWICVCVGGGGITNMSPYGRMTEKMKQKCGDEEKELFPSLFLCGE